ncbi:Lipase, GDSL [Corchorus olitorius]|uniref:Lipase, GDSL n=1 Tax=Corchorus olitorius TaxID=93759 RepID=A0A1R3H6A8_9ROSI|nr:Lipase, GDSL [Corchorus olitorius]
MCYLAGTCSAQNVSAFFAFGDSLVDAGNSYYLHTMAKAGYPDDEGLGFKDYSPPFLDPNSTGDVILKGVNYACAGSGILNSTGYINGQHIGMSEQVGNFAKTRQEIISRIGEAAAKQLLRQALYMVSIGSDDIILRQLSPSNGFHYLDELISEFRTQLITLYNLDARKIAVTNVAPLGCLFIEIYISYQMVVMFSFPYVLGFENADSACCTGGPLGRHGAFLFGCRSFSHICEDRTKYVFWDRFHPSEAYNLIAAKHMLDGGLHYVSPMNLHQLAISH